VCLQSDGGLAEGKPVTVRPNETTSAGAQNDTGGVKSTASSGRMAQRDAC
jgi:hypothetical protein